MFSSVYSYYQNQNRIKCLNMLKPDPTELAYVLENGLREGFEHVTAQWGICPDLTREPFNLAASKLGGQTAVIDVGGTSISRPNLCGEYDIVEILKMIGLHNLHSFIFGDSVYSTGNNELNELFTNVSLSYLSDGVTRANHRSSIVQISSEHERCISIPITDNKFYGRGTFFLSKDSYSIQPVLKLHATKLKYREDYINRPTVFTDLIQKAIQTNFSDLNNNTIMALGGVYVTYNADWRHYFTRNSDWGHPVTMSRNGCIVGTPTTRMAIITSSLTKFILPIFNTPMKLNASYVTRCLNHHTAAETNVTYYTNRIASYVGYFCLADELFRIDEPKYY